MPEEEKEDRGTWVFALTVHAEVIDAKYPDSKEHATLLQNFKVHLDDYYFQLEQGSETGRYHLQCLVKSVDRKREDTMFEYMKALIDFPCMLHCRYASVKGREELKKYCMKKDETHRAGPWTKRKVYLGEDLPKSLLPWQDDLWKELQVPDPPLKRGQIIWICDPVGGLGKSTFAKWLGYHHDIPLYSYGGSKNVLSLVSNNMGKSAYLFDLPRTKPKDEGNDIYCTLEQIKNGSITDTMYKGQKTKYMYPPHVVVFANWMPNQKCLSADKWDIRVVDGHGPGCTLKKI